MARGNIGLADFTFDTASGMEDELNSITINFDVPSADITAFSDAYQNVVAGKPAMTLDVAGSWDGSGSGADAVIFAELGQVAKAYDAEPDGTYGYDGFAIVTSYSITATVTDAVKYTLSLQHNGQSAAIDGDAPNRAG